jgi:3-methyl-2-oxobutanoate hydroxymethyltransferase
VPAKRQLKFGNNSANRSTFEQISQSLNIPTIGIGAGVDCDGQVLVSYDMLGITQNPPKFVKNFLTSGSIISAIHGV